MGYNWSMCQSINIWNVLDESCTDEAVYRKVMRWRRVTGAIGSLVNAMVLHVILLIPLLMYGSETVIWREEGSRIRVVQMDNFKGLLGIRRMDKVPNAQIRGLCRVTKGRMKGFITVFSGGFTCRKNGE